MSYHILHVFKHGSILGKDRGFLVCKGADGSDARIPHADVRAVIIAARGVTLTSNFVAAIMETDGIILHCNESYQPCGVTAPLARVVDTNAYLHQAERPKRLNARLWQELIRGKTCNQQRVLKRRNLFSTYLEFALKRDTFDEGNCARRYWQLYFPSIGWASSSRDRKEKTPPNQMLNYGYAVLAALCHRSLIIHGLSPLLGVKHIARFHSDPLVYDLMEPFRPAVDLMLAEFMVGADITMKAWSKKVGTELRELRVMHERFSLKLMDAIDASANSLARSYAARSAEPFWVPELS
ncbi:MAG: type II CRISPR-associated endonuclease Cas1 [Verrucomicrobia bacterium]|nr:type II CRISPR-associated endonuclease Cas1 [Verrucomicrobiota bacterium]